MTTNIPGAFRQTLLTHLPYANSDEFAVSDDLAALGLNSMGVVQLLTDLEETFGLEQKMLDGSAALVQQSCERDLLNAPDGVPIAKHRKLRNSLCLHHFRGFGDRRLRPDGHERARPRARRTGLRPSWRARRPAAFRFARAIRRRIICSSNCALCRRTTRRRRPISPSTVVRTEARRQRPFPRSHPRAILRAERDRGGVEALRVAHADPSRRPRSRSTCVGNEILADSFNLPRMRRVARENRAFGIRADDFDFRVLFLEKSAHARDRSTRPRPSDESGNAPARLFPDFRVRSCR